LHGESFALDCHISPSRAVSMLGRSHKTHCRGCSDMSASGPQQAFSMSGRMATFGVKRTFGKGGEPDSSESGGKPPLCRVVCGTLSSGRTFPRRLSSLLHRPQRARLLGWRRRRKTYVFEPVYKSLGDPGNE